MKGRCPNPRCGHEAVDVWGPEGAERFAPHTKKGTSDLCLFSTCAVTPDRLVREAGDPPVQKSLF